MTSPKGRGPRARAAGLGRLRRAEETLSCDFLIGDETFSFWQISQKAIGDLLFFGA